MRIGIIIQARMGSSRLPGKIFKKIGDKCLLEHILFRLKFLKSSTKNVVATSTLPGDDIVEEFCKSNNTDCFRGSELNVLERYYQCAKQYNFDHIVRLTADNPFLDIEELDNLIDLHIKDNMDYTNSFASLPVGVGAEIFTFKTLQKCYILGKQPHHLEHVNEYALENPQLFKTFVLIVPESKNRPDVRLTVDTESDYRKACFIAENIREEYITTEEAVKLCLQFV